MYSEHPRLLYSLRLAAGRSIFLSKRIVSKSPSKPSSGPLGGRFIRGWGLLVHYTKTSPLHIIGGNLVGNLWTSKGATKYCIPSHLVRAAPFSLVKQLLWRGDRFLDISSFLFNVVSRTRSYIYIYITAPIRGFILGHLFVQGGQTKVGLRKLLMV